MLIFFDFEVYKYNWLVVFANPFKKEETVIVDDPEKLNWIMAYEGHILEQNYKDIEERKQAYSKVTPEQLTNLARKLFNTKNMVITIKLDKEEDKNNKKENTKKNKTKTENKIKEKDIKTLLKTLD